MVENDFQHYIALGFLKSCVFRGGQRISKWNFESLAIL